MPRKLYDETVGYQIQDWKATGNRNDNTEQQQNRKETRQDKSRGFTGVYLTLHILIQQEEVQKVTRET